MADFHPSTVISSIAGLSVTGLTICSLANIPEQVDTRANGVLFPDITNLVSDTAMEDVTFGGPAAEKDTSYTLTYVYAYKPVEAGRRITEYAASMVALAELFVETVTTSVISGAIRVTLIGMNLGIVTDPAGNQFFGGFIKLRILEFLV